jgi:uncharacterized membrane protein YedE/YeeE
MTRNRAVPWLIAFAGGALFSLGLALSGMTDPAKVLGFLDIAGHWDPTLMFVMGGGVLVFAVAWRASRRLRAPLFASSFPQLPERIDRRLVVGALLFGAGWGLVGFCPGPALVAVGAGVHGAFLFVAAMVAGMYLEELFARRNRRF